jgi:hypothetical protein
MKSFSLKNISLACVVLVGGADTLSMSFQELKNKIRGKVVSVHWDKHHVIIGLKDEDISISVEDWIKFSTWLASK